MAVRFYPDAKSSPRTETAADSRDKTMGDDSLGECPKCGEDVLGMSITGPHEAYLMPCGHIAPPDAVRDDE